MQQIDITVYPKEKIKPQGELFGIFFEDLNHAADGGLYGELVQNRSFEFDKIDNDAYHALTAWEKTERGGSTAAVSVESSEPLNEANPHFLRLAVDTAGAGGGVTNRGYGAGVPLERGRRYRFSCWYRRRSERPVTVLVLLEDAKGLRRFGEGIWEADGAGWTKVSLELDCEGTDYEGRLTVLVREPAVLDLDMVSLFPKDTFLGRENGMRRDIAERIKELKPAFMRFPGGCLIHIGSLNRGDRDSIYRWKDTLGAPEERPARRNTWNYNQSLGLGYFEYFQFCEDIGASPIPVIAAGYDPHFLRAAEPEHMQEWIDEALDLIEFANGAPDTRWGSVRAEMGHPQPFGMQYLGIGNEEVGDGFFERYRMIAKAVSDRWPQIKLICSGGPGSAGSEFEKGWQTARETGAAFVDEHFYQCPEWLIAHADRYETYAQDGPSAFLGEYASGAGTWKNALAEAVFMIGMEKAKKAGMACYAPLLCHTDYKNWEPDLIYFDNHRVCCSPSYYVQKLFMNYKGQSLLKTGDNLKKRRSPSPALTGKLYMGTKNGSVHISGFTVREPGGGPQEGRQPEETGPDGRRKAFILSAEAPRVPCGEVNASAYEIAFVFEKQEGTTAEDLEGQRSFYLEFASRDEENCLRWEFDGWQRLTALRGQYRGGSCDMGLALFPTETHRKYQCVLRVEDGRIRAYIDGKLCCEHQCRAPEPEKLYYSAVGEGGSVYVKIANPQEEEQLIAVRIEGWEEAWAEAECIEGVGPEEKNSFEEPERTAPQKKRCPVKDGTVYYKAGAYSFGVLKIRRTGGDLLFDMP